jgi:hypothetical protein
VACRQAQRQEQDTLSTHKPPLRELPRINNL